MGVDAAELNETIDPATGYRVTATAGALPWERAIPTIKKAALEIYAVLNGTLKICPTSMEGWFQGYTHSRHSMVLTSIRRCSPATPLRSTTSSTVARRCAP